MRLLDPGAEPRSDLSYAIARGPAPKLAMAMDTAVSMKANEAELPQITMTLDGWAGEANAAVEWKIRASFVDVGLEARSAQGAPMHAALSPQLSAMKGLRMSCWLSPKGRTRDVKIDLPKGLPPGAQTRIDGLD